MPRVGRWACPFLLLLTACATVQYDIPHPSQSAIANTKIAMIEEAAQLASSRRARVYELAWPILTANAALCPDPKPAIGVVIADLKLHARLDGGIRVEDAQRLGVSDAPHLYHVQPGSPADDAGLLAGDIVTNVEGQKVEGLADVARRLRETLADDGEVALGVLRGDEALTVSLTGVNRCDMAVKIAQSDALNASAGTGDIVIYQGLIRALDDPALQYVIAHEAAHLAAHHQRKYTRNLLVSGGVVTMPLLYSGAWIGDRASALLGRHPEVSLRRRAIRAAIPWTSDFEAEADYLGAYFFVRAGGDLAAAEQAFEVFGREAPKSIYARATHPLVPERIEALRATAAEIAAEQAAGEVLVPSRRRP